jgi:hypothetical protein
MAHFLARTPRAARRGVRAPHPHGTVFALVLLATVPGALHALAQSVPTTRSGAGIAAREPSVSAVDTGCVGWRMKCEDGTMQTGCAGEPRTTTPRAPAVTTRCSFEVYVLVLPTRAFDESVAESSRSASRAGSGTIAPRLQAGEDTSTHEPSSPSADVQCVEWRMECDDGSVRSGCAEELRATWPLDTRCSFLEVVLVLPPHALSKASLAGDDSLTLRDKEPFADGVHAASLAPPLSGQFPPPHPHAQSLVQLVTRWRRARRPARMKGPRRWRRRWSRRWRRLLNRHAAGRRAALRRCGVS